LPTLTVNSRDGYQPQRASCRFRDAIGYGEGVCCSAAMTTDRRLAAVPRLL